MGSCRDVCAILARFAANFSQSRSSASPEEIGVGTVRSARDVEFMTIALSLPGILLWLPDVGDDR